MTKTEPSRVRLSATVLAGVIATFATIATSGVGGAQLRIPKADLTPIVETDPVRSGTTAIVSLKVELDEALHVQSDKPRDELLIPTVLSLSPPEGVAVEQIVYPPAEDLEQAGADDPLSVFPHEFTIEVRLAIESGVALGPIDVPGRLGYQACDETMCYPPASADTSWTLTVSETP